MFEDNMTCIRMSESKLHGWIHSAHAAVHLDARYHWLREQVVTDKSIRLVYVPTPDQVADCLTKPLPGPDIKRFHGALSGYKPIPLEVSVGASVSLSRRRVPFLCSLMFRFSRP
jgi:hypothetical protein